MSSSDVTVGDVAELVRGVTYDKTDARGEAQPNYLPLLRATNIVEGRLSFESVVFVPSCVVSELQRVQPGDIVLAASSGSLSLVGKAALLREAWQGTFGAFCYVVRPKQDIVLAEYLAYFMQSSGYRRRVSELAAGVNINNLRREHVLQIPVPYVGLEQQRRVVEVLDSVLSRLEDAVASLERAQAKLRAYRASVLKASVEGRLVPPEAELAQKEGRPYEPAEMLLERIMKERRHRWEETELARMKSAGKPPKDEKWKARYSEPEPVNTLELPTLPTGWAWARVSSVGSVQLGRQRAPQHHRGPHMRPYLRVANVFEDRIDTGDVLTMNFSPEEFEVYRLEPGDILLNEGQSPHLIGRPAMYRGEVPGACFQNTLVRFKASSGVDPGYALIVFRAQLHARRYMRIAQITTNIAHLGAGRFAEVEFPLPPLAEQRRLVTEVERLMTVTYAVDKSLDHERRRCARLRQSILAWAFQGRLVDQDPADEPVATLLDRIRAEHATTVPATPKPKRARKLRAAS